jgi:outer membrane protein assembly factor BamD
MLSLLAVSLYGCGSDEQKYVEKPVEDLYNHALDILEEENYIKAAQAFDEVERQHPYSYWATRAQLMAAYAYYKARAYEKAIEALDAFIQLHPGHEDVAYAYYLKGFCYYHQLSIVERDQKMTELALEALNEVIRRFPQSPYARDGRLKVQLAKDHLAGKDMQVGRFYQRTRLPLAAICRFTNVVESYQGTTHIPEALHRLVESYLSLGMYEQARRSAAVLGHNYPGSHWYEYSYRLLTQVGPRDSEAPSFTPLTQGMKKPESSLLEEESEKLEEKSPSPDSLMAAKRQGKIILPEGKVDSDPPPSLQLNQRPPSSLKKREEDEESEGMDPLPLALLGQEEEGSPRAHPEDHDPSMGLAEMKDLVKR